MHNFARSMVVIALVVTVTACGERPSSTEPSQAMAPATTPDLKGVVLAPVANPVDSLVRTMATDPISTQVGKLVEGRVTNGGKAGFLLFGPYVSFSAGTYTVTPKGRIEELPAGQKVRLDVVSARARPSMARSKSSRRATFLLSTSRWPMRLAISRSACLFRPGSNVAVVLTWSPRSSKLSPRDKRVRAPTTRGRCAPRLRTREGERSQWPCRRCSTASSTR